MNPAYRPLRMFGLLGLVALVASTAGAIFALNPNGTGSRKNVPPPAPTSDPNTPTMYGQVDTETGVLPLFPLQAGPGRVVAVDVHENQIVKKGAALVKVDDRLARNRFLEAEADYKQATAQLSEAEKAPKQFEAKKVQQQAAVEAMSHRLAAAIHARDRKQQLLKDNLANALEVAAAEEQVKELQQAVKAEQSKLDELKLLDPQVTVVRAQADAAAKKARMEQAQFALDECVLIAPADGEVLQVLVSPGSLVGGTTPALYFCPTGPQIVRADVEQEFVHRLKIGQLVSVQDENGVGESWRGKVTRLSDWYTRPRTQSPDPFRASSNEVRTLECVITLDHPRPFRLGQRVRVSKPDPS